MISPDKLVRMRARLGTGLLPSLEGAGADFAYDLNEAQEIFFGERNDQLLLIGSTRTDKREILEWLIDNIDGDDTGRDQILFLDFTLPPMHGADIIGLVENGLSQTSGSLYLFINEFHLLDEWQALLRRLHDDYHGVRFAGASSLCGPVQASIFAERLDHCKVVVLSERDPSNRKSHSEGFGTHDGLKYNIKSGEVEIKGLTKAAKSRPRVDVPAEIDGRPVTILASGAFHDRSTLLEISLPPSIRSIGDYAFSRCTSLKQISLPKGLEHIGDNVFLGCTELDCIEGGESLRRIGNCAFYATGWLGNQKSDMVTLGRVLYSYRGQAEVASVPECIDFISNYAFAFNDQIRQIVVTNPRCELGEGIAYNCRGLHSFAHAGGHVEIPAHSFTNCTQLQSVDAVAVGMLGDFAFCGCARLERLELSGPLQIGHCAFLGCSALVGLEGDFQVAVVSNGSFCATKRLEVEPSFLMQTISIGHFAFQWSNIRHVELQRARQIGGWAFSQCANIALVRMPDLEYLGPSPFEGCAGISEMTIGGGRRLASLFGGQERISGTLRTLTVTGDRICTNFARGCTSIESLTIASSIVEWSGWAFHGCIGLEFVKIEGGVPKIGDWAFCHCSALGRVSLPRSVTRIGMNAFRYCQTLREISLLADMHPVTISVNAFYANHEDRRFLIPKSMIAKYRAETSWCEHLNMIKPLGHED